MKRYNVPSLEVKEFSRVSILTASEPTTTTTNVEAATAALKGADIEDSNIKKITL